MKQQRYIRYYHGQNTNMIHTKITHIHHDICSVIWSYMGFITPIEMGPTSNEN